jgi:hypothetical protein
MSCNYYARIKHCPFCGRNDQIHLGKSSIGWTFLLQANNFEYYHSWQEMKEWLRDTVIENEYEERVEIENFIKLVEYKYKEDGALNHQRNDKYNIPEKFVTTDPEGYEFHNGDFS